MTTSYVKNELDTSRHMQVKQVQRLLDVIGGIRLKGELVKASVTDLLGLTGQLSQKIKETEEIIEKMEAVI